MNEQHHFHYCVTEFGIIKMHQNVFFFLMYNINGCFLRFETGIQPAHVQCEMVFYSQPFAGKPLLDINKLKPLRTSDLLQQTHASAFGLTRGSLLKRFTQSQTSPPSRETQTLAGVWDGSEREKENSS